MEPGGGGKKQAREDKARWRRAETGEETRVSWRVPQKQAMVRKRVGSVQEEKTAAATVRERLLDAPVVAPSLPRQG